MIIAHKGSQTVGEKSHFTGMYIRNSTKPWHLPGNSAITFDMV
jgi:hypothetical protein